MVTIMKILSILFLSFIIGCSSGTPVNMEEVLYERGGRFITSDDYSSLFYKNQKVYSGPGFKLYKNGKKKEQGTLKNGWKSEIWTGWYKNGEKKFDGSYLKGNPHGPWTGFYRSKQKKYEGSYELGFQVGKWVYFTKKGKKRLEEEYFVCTQDCEDSHPPARRGKEYICNNLGKIINSQKF